MPTDAQSRASSPPGGPERSRFGANSRLHQIERLTLPTQEQIAAEVLRTHEGIVHAVEDGDKRWPGTACAEMSNLSASSCASAQGGQQGRHQSLHRGTGSGNSPPWGLRVLYLARDGQDEYDCLLYTSRCV